MWRFTLSLSLFSSLCVLSRLPLLCLCFGPVPCCFPKRGGWGWGRPSVLLLCLRLQQPVLSLSWAELGWGATGRTTTHTCEKDSFTLPENGDLTVYQKKTQMHATCCFSCFRPVPSLIYSCIIWFVHQFALEESRCCLLSVFFATYFLSCSHIKLSGDITVVRSLLSLSCLSRIP